MLLLSSHSSMRLSFSKLHNHKSNVSYILLYMDSRLAIPHYCDVVSYQKNSNSSYHYHHPSDNCVQTLKDQTQDFETLSWDNSRSVLCLFVIWVENFETRISFSTTTTTYHNASLLVSTPCLWVSALFSFLFSMLIYYDEVTVSAYFVEVYSLMHLRVSISKLVLFFSMDSPIDSWTDSIPQQLCAQGFDSFSPQ